jgi:hypothetical protein
MMKLSHHMMRQVVSAADPKESFVQSARNSAPLQASQSAPPRLPSSIRSVLFYAPVAVTMSLSPEDFHLSDGFPQCQEIILATAGSWPNVVSFD